MLEYLQEIDTSLFLFLNGLHNLFFDKIMTVISGKLTWIPLYLTAIFFIFKKLGTKRGIITFISFVIVIALADLTSVHLFKNIFERLRPCHNEAIQNMVHIVNNHCGGSFGFVSSHAANSYAFAVFSLLLFKNKKYSIAIIIWASIVAYSRVYLGVHYPVDILGGAILGSFIAFAIYKIYQKLFFRNKISNT